MLIGCVGCKGVGKGKAVASYNMCTLLELLTIIAVGHREVNTHDDRLLQESEYAW